MTATLSLHAFNVYAQTSYRTSIYVRISLVLLDSGCFEEMRTEKAGLRREKVYTLDAYNGSAALKEEASA